MNYTIKAIETRYKGHLFRSQLEATWAAFFDLCGWQWEYEPFPLNGWLPDFALYGTNGSTTLVEVKPVIEFPRDVARKIYKASYPLKEGDNLLILGNGIKPNHAEGVPNVGWISSLIRVTEGWIIAQDSPEDKRDTVFSCFKEREGEMEEGWYFLYEWLYHSIGDDGGYLKPCAYHDVRGHFQYSDRIFFGERKFNPETGFKPTQIVGKIEDGLSHSIWGRAKELTRYVHGRCSA